MTSYLKGIFDWFNFSDIQENIINNKNLTSITFNEKNTTETNNNQEDFEIIDTYQEKSVDDIYMEDIYINDIFNDEERIKYLERNGNMILKLPYWRPLNNIYLYYDQRFFNLYMIVIINVVENLYKYKITYRSLIDRQYYECFYYPYENRLEGDYESLLIYFKWI